MSKLLDLTSDILFDEILSKLSWPSISACLSTCTTLRNGINASPWLSYQKELYLSAMIDNPRSSVPLWEKIERLKTRETRWTKFTPRSISFASILDVNEGHYEVEDGLYVFGREEPGTSMTSVVGWRLPADEDEAQDDPVSLWQHLTLDTRIIDFGVSVYANDLIVFACYTPTGSNRRKILIDLRQWSTKQPHPLATCPILETGCDDIGTSRTLACLRVCGDLLAGVFKYRDAHVLGTSTTRMLVWNWKTGQQVDDIPVDGTSVIFLREDIILVPNTSAFALDIYFISINSSDSAPPAVVSFLRLHLPAFASLYVASRVVNTYIRHCTVEPSLTRGSPQYLSPLRPFSADPAESVVYFNIHLNTSWERSPVYDLLVHRRTLLQLSISSLVEREGQALDGASPISVPWEDWGPENCRMFDATNYSNPFVACANGTRFASLTPSDNELAPERELRILDFNRAKVRQAQIQARNGGKVHDLHYDADGIGLVDRWERTVIEKSDLFKEDVVTTLPYLCTAVAPGWRGNLASMWDGSMLSEECFLGTITGSSQSPYLPEKVEVLYFG